MNTDNGIALALVLAGFLTLFIITIILFLQGWELLTVALIITGLLYITTLLITIKLLIINKGE